MAIFQTSYAQLIETRKDKQRSGILGYRDVGVEHCSIECVRLLVLGACHVTLAFVSELMESIERGIRQAKSHEVVERKER